MPLPALPPRRAAAASRPLRIGYVPLTDCAPLVVAHERGIFARHGLRVQLRREAGWATVREKMLHGELDASQAPVSMVFEMSWGLGVVPGANIGDDGAIFEAVHGSAPDIAGKGVANPLALLMSAVMLLNYVAESRADAGARTVAERIRAAYDRALAEGRKTRDLGGTLGTREFADAVIQRL